MQIRNLKTYDILRKCEQGNTKSISLQYQIKYTCFKKHLEILHFEIMRKNVISCWTDSTFLSSDIQKLHPFILVLILEI